ncbi:hypothetical protein GOV14_01900 [Candidatus Pacearchaeota archaeon]|nr:hypothetical protein [Candidatus Pacearchaeota archaeon]
MDNSNKRLSEYFITYNNNFKQTKDICGKYFHHQKEGDFSYQLISINDDNTLEVLTPSGKQNLSIDDCLDDTEESELFAKIRMGVRRAINSFKSGKSGPDRHVQDGKMHTFHNSMD